MLLKGKSIVVTGGNSGIGKAIVLAAAAEGANVVVDYRMHPDYAAEVIAAAGQAGGRAVGVEADVSRTEDLHRIIQTAVENFGRLDVLVSNAGIETRTSLLETSEADFDKVLAVNLKSAFFGAQFAAQQFMAQGSGGLVVTISSTHEDWAMPGNIAYCVSKGGAKMLTRTAGVELGSLGNPVRQRRAGRGEHPDQRRHRDGPGTAQAAERGDPARPDRPGRRDRRRGRVSRIGQGRVPQRHHGHRRRRPVTIERGTVTDHYDVLVIGSGPGGATTAARVAETGKRVLLLERGDVLPRERDNWDSRAVFGDTKYTADETFYDARDRPFRPELHYYVGGNSKVYGAALLRLLPADFGEVRHPDGVAPAWPLGYDDMEPYYVRAEHLFWVHGEHGEDPFAGPSSRDYPYPPVRHEPRIQQLSDGLTELGLHPFHLPLGVHLTQDAHGRAIPDSRCIRCDRIDGFPCPLGAKADAEWAVIRPALAAHPNLTLMTSTTAQRLLTDAGGRSVTGVAATLPDGSPHTFTADIVVLSAGAILSAAFLLKSASDRHPHGLANSSDQVGRNYLRHNNLALIAFSREPNPTVFQKTLALNDFYGPGEGWPYPMGHIQMLGKSDDWQIKGAAPRGFGWAPSAPYGEVARHSIDFWLSSEDLPLADSRITLRRDGTIRLALQPDNNTEGLTRLRLVLQGMLGKLGMLDTTFVRSLYLHKGFDHAATAHQAGTARFGTDPSASVLDVHCKAHDLDNLYVVDGSFMPSIGAVNPTLTIIANALRVGDHIAERIGTTS